jgi:NitT/TauT family transport system permease protein
VSASTAPAARVSLAQALERSPLLMGLAQAGLFLAVLVAWQLASDTLIPRLWISSPLAILGVLQRWVVEGSIWMHLGATITAMLAGYTIGAVAGIALGFLLGRLPLLDDILSPYLAAIYCLPKIALLPLFVIFLGIGIESKIALVALVTLFLVLYATRDGVRDVDRDLTDMLQLMGATRGETLRKVVLPPTLSWIYTGLRIAVSYAFTTTVVGELLSSNRGLGFLIASSAARFDSAGVFAAVLVLVVCSVALTELLNRMERHASRWRSPA